jgi:lipoate-protein ligase A
MGAVNEVTARPVSLAVLHAALRQGFRTTFGVELIDMPISPEEWRLAQHLRATKYATDAWNLAGAAAWRHLQRSVPSL